MLLAIAVTLATPEAFVTAVAAESTVEGPFVGAVNVTTTPLTGEPEGSFTTTCSGVAKAVLSTVDCKAGEAVTEAVGPTVRVALTVVMSPAFCGLIRVIVPLYVPVGRLAATF